MDKRPIGIFDSGFGGLTALAVLRQLRPEENIVYFGDTARMPYGEKTPDQLRTMAAQDIALLKTYHVKAVLAACGTVSSNVPDIIDRCDIPSTGVVRPTVSRAISSGNLPVGIIATAASIRSGAFSRGIHDIQPDRVIVEAACPDFVTLIEAGYRSDSVEIKEAVTRYLNPIRDAGCRSLILGCTHFGIIADAIRAYLGADVQLLSASRCAAEYLAGTISDSDSKLCGKTIYLTSGSASEFADKASAILNCDLHGFVSHVPPQPIE